MNRFTKLGVTTVFAAVTVFAHAPKAEAQECFIGEVRYFAGNFAPRGWAIAQGQLLAISSNSALFSILGTTYGGDGRNTFGLPDLRGRAPVGVGQGPGLTDKRLGSKAGAESANVTVNVPIPAYKIPSHTHGLKAVSAEDGKISIEELAAPKLEAKGNGMVVGPSDGSSTSPSTAQGAAVVPTVPPYLTLTPIICLQGIYPSRS